MINPEALTHWLTKPLPRVPDFKNMSLNQIHELIESRTGKAFKVSKGGPLWDHQLRALCAALYFGRSLCFLGMRTGKTRVMLEFASHLRRCGLWEGTGLVIVPSPTALGPWRLQMPDYCHLEGKIVRSGSNNELLDALDAHPDLVVIAWSSLQQLFSVKKTVKVRGKDEYKNRLVFDWDAAKLAAECFSLLCVDEIHYCKTPTALITKTAIALSRCSDYRLGLTGTPFGRNPFDLWSQAFICDEGKAFSTSYHFFTQAFGKVTQTPWLSNPERGRTGPSSLLSFDKKKLPVLATKAKQLSIAYELEEIRTLKEKRIETQLQMAGEQLAIYQAIIEELVERVKLGATALENAFIRLRRASSGQDYWVDEEGKPQVSNLPTHAKLRWLHDKIAAGDFERSSIIFYSFTATGKQIVSELKRAGITCEWLHGGVVTGRDEMVARFQAGKSKVFVANSQSGAEAIDLSAADYLCFYEPPISPTKRVQAEKRPMAASRGTRELVIEDVLCSPVDNRILHLTKEGKTTLKQGIYSGADLKKQLGLFKI